MNYKRFSVRGTNPESGRKKTITLDVPNNTTPYAMVLQQKTLNEPLEINEIPFRPPSDRQLEYAHDLGVKIPKDACLEDAIALISFAVDSDSTPNPDLIEYATNKGFMFSKCIGKKSLYNLIFNNLPPVDKIAFFCFSIYRYLSDDRNGNLDTSPYRDTFYSFAQQYEEDKKFVSSMLTYEGKDLRYFGTMRIKEDDEAITVYGGSVSKTAYKIVADYLHSKFNTPLTLTKEIQGETGFNRDRYSKRPIKNKSSNAAPKPADKKTVLKGIGIILIIIGVVGLSIDFLTGLAMIGTGIVLIVLSKRMPIGKNNTASLYDDMSVQGTADKKDASQLATEASNDDSE
jgi:hypothetical protein